MSTVITCYYMGLKTSLQWIVPLIYTGQHKSWAIKIRPKIYYIINIKTCTVNTCMNMKIYFKFFNGNDKKIISFNMPRIIYWRNECVNGGYIISIML